MLKNPYAQTIPTAKLEARQFFIMDFEGTPFCKKHKTIFSGLAKLINSVWSTRLYGV
jgi:hypothetical protein